MLWTEGGHSPSSLEHDERMWSLLGRFLVAASADRSLGPRVAINDHGPVGRYNNCSPFPGSMTARQWIGANLGNVVFPGAVLTSEVLDGLDAVNKAADVRTFGDAVDAHAFTVGVMGKLLPYCQRVA